jgi:predicted TIM-barrel fold metal-dependent hydrolase
VRNLWIPASVPPGGKSPADRAISPFWSLCEEADATVQLHLGFENFMQTDVWRQIPEFRLTEIRSLEFTCDPWTLATVHMPAANFLTVMILGGVFERHPGLRFGVIETGAYWVGPLAESLDMWADVSIKQRQLEGVLSKRPSEYLSDNVRVTPFIFEPVDMYFERYGLESVFCYGSDYPHAEGGKHQVDAFAAKLAPLGSDILEKFFVSNGEFLMPSMT